MVDNLVFDFDISKIEPADYNPRKIDDDSISSLKKSLEVLGCVKPIIVRGKTIVAGHQRTKALSLLGVKKAVVFLISGESTAYDEVRFNQLHNGTDLDFGAENTTLKLPEGKTGFVFVDPDNISCDNFSRGAVIRSEIMNLILKYGLWGSCVCNTKGEVFHAAQYAISCKILNKPLLAFVVDDQNEEFARESLARKYGVFSYEKIKRETYIQTFAQLNRLRKEEGEGKQSKSKIYEIEVIPFFKENPKARFLDFGCGKGDYVAKMKRMGADIHGVELFRRKEGEDSIDVSAVNKMIDDCIKSINLHGLFDFVVCDYVLNSVDSTQAEIDVMNCLVAFCKPGGIICFSGRTRDTVEQFNNYRYIKNETYHSRRIYFLDENGFTANFRFGRWFFQKYHTEQQVDELASKHGIGDYKKFYKRGIFYIRGLNVGCFPVKSLIDSLRREFDIVINSKGRSLGRADDVIKCIVDAHNQNREKT